MAKKKKFHIVGKDESGNPVFEERGSKKPEVFSVAPMKEGRPIDPDVELVHLRPDGEGHFTKCPLGTARSGPAQVATDSYRSGWDATFKTSN